MLLYIKSSLLTNSENSYEYTLSSLCYRGASKYDQAYAQCDYSSFGDKKICLQIWTGCCHYRLKKKLI